MITFVLSTKNHIRLVSQFQNAIFVCSKNNNIKNNTKTSFASKYIQLYAVIHIDKTNAFDNWLIAANNLSYSHSLQIIHVTIQSKNEFSSEFWLRTNETKKNEWTNWRNKTKYVWLSQKYQSNNYLLILWYIYGIRKIYFIVVFSSLKNQYTQLEIIKRAWEF